jgi:hypothetical protein
LTDVFLLGATLYEILTGHPPRQGKSHDDIVEMVRSVPPAPARRLNPACPRALEAIAAKAMAMRPQDRYSTAMDLAADVQRFLADEPISACSEPLAARLWRWTRRHRVALARVAASLLILAAAVTAIAALKHARTLQREAADLRAAQKARDDLTEFRRLADDARYLAANSDPVAEHAPYFDLRAGQSAAEAALAVADRWHDGITGWPLARDPGADLGTDVFRLILLTAQVRALRGEPLAPTLALMDRAAAAARPGTPMAAYHRVLAACYRAAAPARADEEERLAAADGAVLDAEDAFLAGERLRHQSAALTADEQQQQQQT